MNCFAPAPNAARRSLFDANRLSEARTVSLPVSAAVAQRSMWLDCVALWIVSWPVSASISITEPRVSIGWFDCRWHDNRSVTTRSAAANTASTSP